MSEALLITVSAALGAVGLVSLHVARGILRDSNRLMDETVRLARLRMEQANEALERARALHKRRAEDV